MRVLTRLTNGATGVVIASTAPGTRYRASNPNVATVSADSVITAGQTGEAVINGPAEFLIPVKVQARPDRN